MANGRRFALEKKELRLAPAIGREVFIFLIVFLAIFGGIASVMGGVNMVNTLMNTAFDLIHKVCFYIMAVAVLAGALSGILSEFGVIALINRFLSKLMGPLYDLPGAASLGVLTCYLSDNPAILALARDQNFLAYFKRYQVPALTNIGTSFGMGLIITTTMMGISIPGTIKAAFIGNIGAILGSIVSVRLMLMATKKIYGTTAGFATEDDGGVSQSMRIIRPGNAGTRAMDALLQGGKNGVEMGLAIIPGVLIVCSFVLLLTNGPGPGGAYTGAVGEGVAFLPWLGRKLSFILSPLFGFHSPEAIAVPITALGSAGAAIGLVPEMAANGLITANDVAVFTAICMCWSGYLSTHIAMMDSLHCNELTGRAIFAHTIGGLFAGVAANLLFKVVSLL